jgi:GMP reductase
MKISEDVKLDFDDVLICPKRSTIESRKDVEVLREFYFKRQNATLKVCPIISANMDTTGTMAMARSLGNLNCLTALHKFYKEDELKEFITNNVYKHNVFYTIGMSVDDLDKLEIVFKTYYLNPQEMKICIDVANGYTEKFVNFVKLARERFPLNPIMAGNVCTKEMTEQLILSGADIVKVGIGPGSVCETRIKTGIGYGQLSAIMECKDAAHGVDGFICADGGCKNAGDVCKAFGAGADFVMIGGMLSGTDECEGEWQHEQVRERGQYLSIPISKYDVEKALNLCYDSNVQVEEPSEHIMGPAKIHFPKVTVTDKKKSLKFYGMSSHEAQLKHYGEIQDYRAAEGSCITVPYKGPAADVIKDILGGLRSACAYVGARRLKDFDKCCSFVRVNRVK